MSPTEHIRAAGGVVVRDNGSGPQVLVVHRPRYGDWSFPKGKLDGGETDEQCALREVREETGLSCELVRELSSTNYHDRYGRPKTVRYWLMSPVSGRFRPNAEVNEVLWVDPRRAQEMLSYRHDAALVDELMEVMG